MITVSDKIIEKNILGYFQHIIKTGEEIIVTNNDIPILKVIPFKQKLKPDDVFKDVHGNIKYYDDILKPETDEWGDI